MTDDAKADASEARLRRMMDDHFDFVWRTVRLLGVSALMSEDAAQQVFCIVARKLAQIAPGSEVAFLFSTATRVAADARRAQRSRPVGSSDDVDSLEGHSPAPDEVVEQHQAREVLQAVLETMPPELRAVFLLFEIEEFTLAEIASLTGVPIGTAASRLRRAREAFEAALKRRRAAESHRSKGGAP